MRMGFSFFKTILITCLLFLSVLTRANVIYPLGQDLFDFDYDIVYRIGVDNQNFSMIPPVGPFTTEFMQKKIPGSRTPSFMMFDKLSSESVRLFGAATEKSSIRRHHRGDDLPLITGGYVYRPGDHFGILTFFNLDRAKAVDPDYTGKKYRGLAGDLETAAMFFNKGRISITLGRQRVFWGPQPVNLLISKTAQPLDLLNGSYNHGRISMNFIFARLDTSRPDSLDLERYPKRSFKDNRYLAAHRLDIRFHRRFRLGLFETIIYGGEGRPPEIYYLNPLQFFHSAQLNEYVDDNTTLGFDFTFLFGKGISGYGQVLVDDFQIDNKQQGDQEPDEIGLMFGLFKTGKIGSFIPDFKAEYVRLTNRTYHQRDPRNRYLFRNKLIGHPLGPDADSVSIKARFWPSSSFYTEIEFASRRRGEGSIYNFWDEPWLDAEGKYSEPFPTGVVEKSFLIALRAKGYLPFWRYTRDHIFISIDAGWGKIYDHQNIPGITRTVSHITLALTWLGSLDVSISD